MTKGSFGFIPSKSKTDNFKVVAPVDTVIDSDHDGIPDSEDLCPTNPDTNCVPVFGLAPPRCSRWRAVRYDNCSS